jgi:hypothetical protein
MPEATTAAPIGPRLATFIASEEEEMEEASIAVVGIQWERMGRSCRREEIGFKCSPSACLRTEEAWGVSAPLGFPVVRTQSVSQSSAPAR